MEDLLSLPSPGDMNKDDVLHDMTQWAFVANIVCVWAC